MAATAQPVKGILKKSSAPDATIEAVAATHSRRQRTEEDNAEIARKHAAIIQQRRDLESSIFQSIEHLTSFPLEREAPYSAAHPAPSDVAAFCRLVRVFQPGDYDDLVEERNTCGLCGYALCARPRQTFAGRGTWKLVNAGRQDFGIVAKHELEKWCSQACARRALYIKVQLNETAAWERVGIPDIVLELLEEEEDKKKREEREKTEKEAKESSKSVAEAQLAQDLARLRLHEERKLAQDATALALERGDVTSADLAAADSESSAGGGRIQPTIAPLVDITIFEKKVTTVPTEPTLDDNAAAADAHLLTEGHKIKFMGA